MTIIERLDRTEARSERERIEARLLAAVGTDDRSILRSRAVSGSLTDLESEDASRLETLDYLLDDRA